MLSWSNDVDCVWTPFLTAFGIWLEPWIILLVVVVVLIIIIITKRNRSSTNNDEQPKAMSCPEHVLFQISWIQFDISVLSIQTNVARCSEIQRYMWRYQDFYRRHRFAHTKRKGGWDVGSPSWFQLLISIKKHHSSGHGFWRSCFLSPFLVDSPTSQQPTLFQAADAVAKAVRHAEILAMGTVRDSPKDLLEWDDCFPEGVSRWAPDLSRSRTWTPRVSLQNFHSLVSRRAFCHLGIQIDSTPEVPNFAGLDKVQGCKTNQILQNQRCWGYSNKFSGNIPVIPAYGHCMGIQCNLWLW